MIKNIIQYISFIISYIIFIFNAQIMNKTMLHLSQFFGCWSSRSNRQFFVKLTAVGRDYFSVKSLGKLYRRRRFSRRGRASQYYEMLVFQNRII